VLVLVPVVVGQVKGEDAFAQGPERGVYAFPGHVRVAGVKAYAEIGRIKVVHNAPHVCALTTEVSGQHVFQGQPNAGLLRRHE
jgi:hypothetical protein